VTDPGDRGGTGASEAVRSRWRRISEARWVLGAAAAAFALLVALGKLAFWPAFAAFCLVAVAAMLAGSTSPAIRPLRAGNARPDEAPTLPQVLEAVPDPIIILDGLASVVSYNASAAKLLPNLRPRQPFAFALRVPEMIDAVRGVMEQGGTRRVDYSERVPVERAVKAHISALPGAEGRRAFVLVVLRDVSQELKAEQMRADFVANASHELRTPLASLLGFIETLQGPARNDAAARDKFLPIMRTQAKRMARLIDDLLSLSRIELKAHIRPDATVDLGSAVGHVIDALAPLAKERGVELALERPPGRFDVAGDRDELIRVFENLVENAIKYGSSGGRVEVILAESPKGNGRSDVAVTVRDHGPGIAAEHLPRLTERFYRVDVGQSRDKGGTGLGLAIVKHILARHRGRMTIESTPGEGASFTVRIERLEVS
jgi:two-component system, OmpR family, phosphate regulon sensor histidine kinase PhoR